MVKIDERHMSAGEGGPPGSSGSRLETTGRGDATPRSRPSMFASPHRDLMAWKKCYALGLELYAVTRSFPASEAFGLTGQLRRAGTSVASNIAEGRGRDSTRDFIRFLNVANGSLAEIDTQIRFAADLDYLAPGRAGLVLQQVDECVRLVHALRSALSRTLPRKRKDSGAPRRARAGSPSVRDQQYGPSDPSETVAPQSGGHQNRPIQASGLALGRQALTITNAPAPQAPGPQS